MRITHLFPDLLRFYGDGGNIATLVGRASARNIAVEVDSVIVGARRLPPADLILVGGGQDREQVTVALELERLGDELIDQVADGAALLAVCGGYQNLGTTYRTALGVDLPCPGLLPVATDASGDRRRLVGPVVARLTPSAGAMVGTAGAPAAGALAARRPADADHGRAAAPTVVGFENHGGRTVLADRATPLAEVEIGHGNNGRDGTEGVLVLPGEEGQRGLRIGTYLHGPLLPRNPHLADLLLAAALGRGHGFAELAPLDDRLDWSAHHAAVERIRASDRAGRWTPRWARDVIDPLRSLIGY